jgi:diguanylate cyclase (GGDEF)-like protein
VQQTVRSLLLVDDEPYILPALVALLKNEFKVYTANSADAAEEVFEQHAIDIVLTDQNMPRRTGVELLEWVRENSPHTIRLLMTGYAELEDAVAAINRGQVYYYLLKPWRTEDLLQILRNASERFELERSNDRLVMELRNLNRELEQRVADRTRELEVAYTQLEQRSRELERLALTDPLTGLFNRRAMEGLAMAELKRHARYDNPLTIALIDVDHFKQINTDYLLTGGDAVLRGLARVLSGSVREVVDSLGRIGGEEFLVIARETNEEGAMTLAERIRTTVEHTPIDYQGLPITVTVSIGVAVADAGVPAKYAEMNEIAAAALQQAKQSGRNCCVVRCVQAVPTAH